MVAELRDLEILNNPLCKDWVIVAFRDIQSSNATMQKLNFLCRLFNASTATRTFQTLTEFL